MAVVLIGNRDGILMHAGETLDELAIAWAWGDPDDAFEAGDIVIVEERGGGDHVQAAGCVVLRVPVDDASVASAVKIERLAEVTSAGGGTLAIGRAGAVNAGLFAGRVLAVRDRALRQRLEAWVHAKRDAVLARPDPSVD